MSLSATASSRLFTKARKNQKILEQLLFALTGFIMSGSSIMMTAAPFGVAWAAAALPGYSLSSAAGAILGYIFLPQTAWSIRYIVCISVLWALKWALSFIPESTMSAFSPFFAAFPMAATGIAAAISATSMVYDIIMVICETAITITAAILFSKAQRSFFNGACLARSNSICTGIFLCTFYMGLCSLKIASVSPAHSFAFAAILCCGFFSGTGISSAAAVAAGLAAAVSGQPFMLAVYCAGGLGCGIFSALGKAGCCAAITVCSLMAYAAQQGFEEIAPVFIECILGCAVFIAVPSPVLRKLGLSAAVDCAEGEMLRQIVTSQLSRMREALCDISEVSSEVSQKLSEINGDPIEMIFAKTCSKVCRGCKSSPKCWQTGYNSTADALNHAFNCAKTKGSVSAEDMPPYFICEKMDKLLSSINEQTTGYIAKRMEKRHLAQLRSVSGDQFGGIGDLLGYMQTELESFCCAPPKISEQVSKYIASVCGEDFSICCYQNQNKQISVLAEIPSHKAVRLLSPTVTEDLSEIVMQELCKPEHILNGASSQILWNPKAAFYIKSAFLQHAANGNKFCGDCCKAIEQSNNRAIMLLCDGMGVGSPAAVDATLTVSLLERLLTAGADLPSALKLVNAALLSGGGEERLCTVDAAILDLCSCRLDAFKAGAAPTFILRKGKCFKIESASLPAGILSGAEAHHSKFTLSSGDLIVMLSDGVIESGCDWIPSQLIALSEAPLEEICEQLLSTAHDRKLTSREDDMTVMAVKIFSS